MVYKNEHSCLGNWTRYCSKLKCEVEADCKAELYDHTPERFIGKRLNLGCAKAIMPYSEGWINSDISRAPGVDVSFDANKTWPFPDDYFEYIWASHILEHLWNLNLVMKEAHRTLKLGGLFEIRVPYGPRGTFCNDDPFHIREFAPSTLDYFFRGKSENTTLEADWEQPLFKQELCETVRIFWRRERLGKILGSSLNITA